MSKRTLSLVLATVMLFSLISVLAGCKETPADYSDEDAGITFVLDETEFAANTINLPLTNQDIALYSRGYTADGAETAFIGGDHTGRTVITVRYNASYNEYSITVVDDTDGTKADTLIPVNGFVASIPTEKLEGLRIREAQTVDVFGFDISDYEQLDLASFIPTKSNLARRIYYVDPIEVPAEDIIYLITEEYAEDTVLGDSVIAVTLEKKSEMNYSVKSILESGTVSAGTVALIFTGKYNCEYALSVLEEGNNVMLSKLENANSVCHESAVKIEDKVYKIGSENTNVSSVGDGVYMFDSSNTAGAVPASDKDYIAVAVKDGTVVYVGEKNERLIIPTNAGYLLVFGGDKLSLGEGLAIGDTIEEILVFPSNTSEKFVSVNGYYYSFEEIDTPFNGNPVLYTPNYGDTTGTSGAVAEIAFQNGKVVSVSTSDGNTAIPENGYVISFTARGDNLKNCKRVSVGDTVRLALSSCEYSAAALTINGFNTTRFTDHLIVYDKSNSNTGTNQYGFEIGVDKNGIMVSASNTGNMKVPEGGYVLSGHGTMSAELMARYIYGAPVKLLKDTNTVVFYSTPLSAGTDVTASLELVKTKYAQAESALYDIDYEYISAKLDACKKLIESVDSAVTEGDPLDAVNSLYTVSLLLSDLEDAMITQKAVEERSIWYRSNVKSDEDVLAVIKKCVEYNINAIYLETWYNGKTVGSTSNPLIQHYSAQHGDYDALEGFIRIGHEHGIQIHAWVENFFIGTKSQIEGDSAHVGNHDESWILLDKDGKDYYISAEYGNFVFLNPQNRQCRDLVLSVYRELLENYELDGLHLDYIRYPEHNGSADFGYNEDTIKAFQAEYGYNSDPHTYEAGTQQYKDWVAYRREVITSFVKEVYDLVNEVRPEVWLTAACYPSLTDAPNNIYQHTTEWVNRGYIDQVFSMTYSNGTEYVSDNAESFVNACKDKTLYSTGLTLFSGNSGEELLSQIGAVRDSGATGQAFFSLSSLLGFEEYEKIMALAYPNKAVSLFDVDSAVLAYAEDLIAKCDGVYSERTTGQEAVISSVKKLLEEIRTEASKQEYNTVAEQKALLAYALERTDAILTEAENADGALKTALEREVGEMDYNLTILYSRMEAKTAE